MPKVIIEVGKGQNADQILASLKAQLGGVADSVSLVSENTRRLEREQRNAERSFRQTAAALDPAIAKSQEYARSQKALEEALKRNIITQQEHDRLLQLAKDRHDDTASGLSGLIAKYGSGATAVAAFAAALAGSLVVLDQVQQFISASISSAAEAERMQAQIDARIASTGGAAELTASQLADMANELQNLSKFDDEGLASAQNVLLTFTSISGDTFREALSAVTDMSTALGTDLATNARLVGKALEDPVKGLSAMSRAGVVFTAGQKELIQSLVESGDLLGAQDLILASLSERFGGAAAADVATFGGSIDRLNNLWDNFQEKVGEGVLPILSSFLTNVGNIIAGNDELAETLGVLVTKGGEMAMAFVSGSAIAAEGFLKMASVVMAGLAGMAEGAADVAELAQLDTLAEGLRKAAAGQRENQQIALALADASGQVATAAFLAATNLGKKGEAARAGAKDSREHAAADEEAAKEAAAFAQSLRGLLDDLDPIGKAEREAAEGIAILNRALAEGLPMDDYQAAIGQLIQRLNDARAAALDLGDTVKFELIDMPSRLLEIVPDQVVPVPVKFVLESGGTELDRESAAAAERFSQNMESGLLSAGETFLMELTQGGEDAWENLGENLTQVLLQSVAEWLVAQLAAIAKAAVAAKAIQGGTGAGGGGGFMGSLASMFGGGGGAGGISSGTLAIGAWVAVAAAAVAIVKHQADSRDGQRYQTTVSYSSGSNSMYMGGKLQETGGKIADAFKALLDEVTSSTGAMIDGTHRAAIAIQNNKKEFQALVDGELIGTFKSADEAIVAAMKRLFSAENLSKQLDPIIQQVIDNFDASKGPQAFADAVGSVTQIVDGLSGLTEVEIALRNIPSQAEQLASSLHAMGVSMADAEAVAAQATVQQFQTLRDQITGHEASAAEQRAEKERQAAYFNAQRALSLANMAMMKADIEYKIANFGLQVEWTNKKYEFDLFKLTMERNLLATDMDLSQAEIDVGEWRMGARNELVGRDMEIAQAEVSVRQAAGNASLAMLQIQLDAINQSMAALEAIKPIDMGEIRIPNLGGGGGGGGHVDVDPGPTEAEQRIQSFLDFLESAQLDGLTNFERRLAEIDRTFAEHSRTLEEMRAASDGSAESLALLAEQEAELAAWRAEQAAALREEIIDGFGSPLEAVRDRISEIQQRVDDWFASGQDLVDQFHRGEIGMDELMAALERANQLWAEFGQVAQMEIMNLALYFSDAMGDTEESARIRAELAEMEWDFKRAELRMLAEAYHAAGMLNDEEYERWSSFIDNLPDNRPADAPPPPPPPDTSAQDDAIEAQRDLIAALEDLADLQRDLWASNLSPLNAEEQAQFLQGQLQDAYNQAKASGSAEDVRAFQDLVRDYLSSYQDAYGSTGGYTAEFLRINELINNLLAMGDIGGIVPGPGILGGPAGTGTGGWRPTPGASGTVLPFERTGGPGSPLVVESPALNALATLTQESNRRLEALERRLAMLTAETERGNQQAASRAFLNRSTDGMVGFSGTPRISRRGA